MDIMRKFVIVSLLTKDCPTTFQKTDWPLHLTLARPFLSPDSNEELIQKVTLACANQTPLVTRGVSRALFDRYQRKIAATEVEHTPELLRLHTQIRDAIGPVQAVGESYDTFRPHVSDQAAEAIEVGQIITLDSVSLVEMDGNNRYVFHIADLK
ncbi:MAG: 2-5 ligase family protein [Parcubacteria group bacterium]|nr:2-5 ligase family protein [Parcubacteria group bacterium]